MDSKIRPLSSTIINRINARVEIQQNPFDEDVGFLPPELIQTTLPHRTPKEDIWQRSNGHLRLTLKADTYIDKKTGEKKTVPLPAGRTPRLVLFWFIREIVRKQQTRIYLGNSINEFMRAVGLDPYTGRGPCGNAKILDREMYRLLKTRITLEVEKGQASYANLDVILAKKSFTPWVTDCPEERGLFESWIDVDQDFYDFVIKHPVPIDMRAIRVLKGSCLALDLYAWATYKTYIANLKGKTYKVSWNLLMQQMGAGYSNAKDFKKRVKASLKQVELAYPGLSLESVDGGLLVKPGKTAVRHKPKSKLKE